jgi:hypothetical protein
VTQVRLNKPVANQAHKCVHLFRANQLHCKCLSSMRTHWSERRGRVVSTAGPETGYPGYQVIFLSPCRQTSRYYFRLGHNRFLPHCVFIIPSFDSVSTEILTASWNQRHADVCVGGWFLSDRRVPVFHAQTFISGTKYKYDVMSVYLS